MNQCRYCGRNKVTRTRKKVGEKSYSLVLTVGTRSTWLQSFCSSECEDNYDEIIKKIKHQKDMERIMRPELTEAQEKNLRRVRDVLTNS